MIQLIYTPFIAISVYLVALSFNNLYQKYKV